MYVLEIPANAAGSMESVTQGHGYGEMSASVEIANPLEDARWNDNLASTPDRSIFHTSNWARVLHKTYGYRPVYPVLRENGATATIIPAMDVKSILTGRRGVALPFTDYCEPISSDNESLRVAMNRLLEFGREAGWKYIEVRGDGYFENDLQCQNYYYGHILSLPAADADPGAEMRDSTRRNIKKALKSGIRVETSTTLEAMREFYRLHCGTRRMHGLPPQPFHFFKNIHEYMISENMGLIILASLEERFIAGSVFFHYGDRAFYKYGASDRRFQELRANNLVMWEAIQGYSERGFKTLCLGRTDSDASGLRQFKTGWGGRERLIRYYRFNLKNDCLTCEDLGKYYRLSRLFSRLPISMLRLIGTLCYRHIG